MATTPQIAEVAAHVGEPARAATLAVLVGKRDTALRAARTCYDHLAGRLGVAIAEGLSSRGVIEFEDDAGRVTDEGVRFLRRAGIMAADDTAGAPRSSRPLCRPCLDCSERRPHVAGRLGAAICRHAIEQAWVRRLQGTRALQITPRGRTQFPAVLGTRLME